MQKCAHLVEFQKCYQTHIFLQKLVLIQPRTSPPKIGNANFANKSLPPASREVLLDRAAGVEPPARSLAEWKAAEVPPLAARYVGKYCRHLRIIVKLNQFFF